MPEPSLSSLAFLPVPIRLAVISPLPGRIGSAFGRTAAAFNLGTAWIVLRQLVGLPPALRRPTNLQAVMRR